MRKRHGGWVVGLVALGAMVWAQTASAATEVGNRCAANTSAGAVVVSLANASGSPLPASIPSSGVITRWSFSVGIPIPPELTIFETLKVFRSTGPKQLKVVGESAPEVLIGGSQTFSTRIPVEGGDLIGGQANVGGTAGAVFCETKVPGDRAGLIVPPAPTGATVEIAEEKDGFQNPIVVQVEPDADGDGFGDETQDACPQSAATQGACPVVTVSPVPPVALDALGLVGRRAVSVYVATSTQAPVHVSGLVKLGKGKTASIDGGTQTVPPGQQVRFKLNLPKVVVERLQKLPRKKKLTMAITADATNVAGQMSSDASSVPLKGLKKK